MIYDKWKNLTQDIKIIRKEAKSFGYAYGAKRLALRLVPYKIRSKSKACRALEYRAVMTYLEKYLPVIREYDSRESKETIGASSNIWLFWWQGYENAPDIVKACVASVRKNAGAHPVVLLDQYNYKEYVTLPDDIVHKFEKGNMMIAHFSDIIRTALIYQYGGIWIDATIYMRHPLDEVIENSSFYSLHHWEEKAEPSKLVFGLWTTFFLGCGKGNYIAGLLNKLLLEYWKQEETVIHYFLMDYFITMIYWNVEDAKRTIDNIAVSNRDIHELIGILNERKDKLKQLQDDGTYLYKLTHKMDFSDSVDGEETIYHMLVHEGWVN